MRGEPISGIIFMEGFGGRGTHKIGIKDINESLKLSIGETSYSLDRIFIFALLQGTGKFFIKMNQYFPGHYDNEMKRIYFLIGSSDYIKNIVNTKSSNQVVREKLRAEYGDQ